MIDCLLIGHNDGNFQELIDMVKSMGEEHPDYRDLNINFIKHEDKAYRALDILDHFYDKENKSEHRPFHNADLLWNVIMCLGTFLTKKGHTFDYINLFQLEKAKLKKKLQENDYLTIAITTTVYTLVEPILEVISFIKQYNDKAKIIVGGPFITMKAENMGEEELKLFCKYIGADFLILDREGMQALVNIQSALKNNLDINDVKNIAIKNGSDYVITASEEEMNSLEENMLDFSLFPKEEIGEFVTIETTKGCPYNCSYCTYRLYPSMYRTHRCLDVENVKKVLDSIREIGTVKSVLFLDGTMNALKDRFKDMMRMIIKENYDFHWQCFFRCDNCDEEMVELMRQAKCDGVFVGLESVNDEVLKNMNRSSRKEDYLRALPLLKKANINIFVSLFVGYPGETYETFQQTMDFLNDMNSDFYRLLVWYCSPVTPIWKQREKYGLSGINYGWTHDTMNAKTACSLMEKAFLCIDSPVWAPDPGYNYTSPYYLKQRGMSIEKQKKFLQCFNAIVREKLIYPNKKTTSLQLIESLKKACQFNTPDEPDMSMVEMFSGQKYREAEKFLFNEFCVKNSECESGVFKYYSIQSEEKDYDHMEKTVNIENSLIDNLNKEYKNDMHLLILVAFYLLKKRLDNKEDINVIVSLNRDEVIPLRLNSLDDLNISEAMCEIDGRIKNILKHNVFALHILTNNIDYQNKDIVFDLAYLVNKEGIYANALDNYPAKIYNDLNLVIKSIEIENKVKVEVSFSKESLATQSEITFLSCFKTILDTIKDNKLDKLKDIKFEFNLSENSLINEFSSKEFNFKEESNMLV